MKTLLLAALAAGITTTAQAQGMDIYAGFDAVIGADYTSFGGFNALGGFSNDDDVESTGSAFRVYVGAADVFSAAGRGVSVEAEYSQFGDQSLVSASFPGLPNPTFFYTTDLSVRTFGATAWIDVAQTGPVAWEAGLGLGAMNVGGSTTDGVVSGSVDETVAYGSLGMRGSVPIDSGLEGTFGVRFTHAGEVDVALNGGAGGNLTLQQNRAEASVGLRFLFN